MKRGSFILSVFFLIQGLSPMGSMEWTKLGHLISHYIEHSQKSHMGFVEYLDLHYGFGEKAGKHDVEDPHNGSLPFHGSALKSPSNLAFFVCLQPTLSGIESKSKVVHYPLKFNIPIAFSEEPFQPPQV